MGWREMGESSAREQNRQLLSSCNALASWDQYDKEEDGRTLERWMPVIIKDGVAYSFSGHKVFQPKKIKSATLEEILDYMDERKTIAVVNFGSHQVSADRPVSFDQPFDFFDAVSKVRVLAQQLVAKDVNPIGRMPHEASQLLQVAWMHCINLEAEAEISKAGLSDLMHQAKEAAEKHKHDSRTPISLSGPAMIVKINGREYPAPAYNMGGARPLWWVYAEMIKNDSSQ